MSHAVVRGQPNASQLYLDSILDEILTAKGIEPCAAERGRLGIAEIIYHSLKKNPNDVFMINGATAEVITNEHLLRRVLSLARTLLGKGLKGKPVMLVMRNHQRMTAVYYAVMFAGVLPFMMDPNTTTYELTHFLKLIEPQYVFCDTEHYKDLQDSLKNYPEFVTNVVISDKDELLDQFTVGFSDDLDGFEIPKTGPDSTVMMLPTSGSTGLPKATLMVDRGLVAQLPSSW